MAESSTEAKGQKAVHPFFATRHEGEDRPTLRVTGKPAVDDLLKNTILNITHLANVASSTVRSQRSSLLGSLDPDTVAPSLCPEAHLASKSKDRPEDRNPLFARIPSEPDSPMSPAAAISTYRDCLTQMELAEIHTYREIYFLGLNAEKVKTDITQPNCGYDDEHRDYKIAIGDHLDFRFQIIRILGRGAFGRVLLCFDHKTKQETAIKVIRNANRFNRQVLVEVQVLETLREMQCRYVVSLERHFKFREHICMQFELLGESVLDWIKEHGFKGLQREEAKRVGSQLAIALKELKRCGIIHADVKPENILFISPSHLEIRLIDFGSACYEHGQMYTYLQSRYYRAPEVILGAPYSFPIDMWSLGCLVAELVTGHPLFPGENERDQLAWIMSAIGVPPSDLIRKSSKSHSFFLPSGEPRPYTNSKGHKKVPGSLSLSRLIPSGDESLLDFVSQCLQWNAEDRISPEQAESHPFLL